MNSFRCSLHVPVLQKHDKNQSWNKTVILAMESRCVLAVDLCRVFPKLLAVIGVFLELAIASSLMFHVNNSWVCALLLSGEPFDTKVYVGSNRCTLSWVSFLLSSAMAFDDFGGRRLEVGMRMKMYMGQPTDTSSMPIRAPNPTRILTVLAIT